MAKAQPISLVVDPVFSLNDIDSSRLSKKVLKHKNVINKALSIIGESLERSAISLLPIPGELFSLTGHRKETQEVFSKRMDFAEGVPAGTPYLLGLFAHEEYLLPRLADTTFVETFCFPNPYSFLTGKNRWNQLSVCRREEKLMLDVSIYIAEGQINHPEGISPLLIRGIFLPKPLVEEEQEEDLSEKMIG